MYTESGRIEAKNKENIELQMRLLIAEDLIYHAVKLMTVEQLSQWTGVRSWLEEKTAV